MTTLILYALVFLLLSGLMAAADAAVLSVTRPEIEELIHHGRSGARHLRDVKQHLARSVVVIVILTNTINVLGPIVVSHAAVNRFGPEALVAVTATLTIGTIVFSEILPKAIGAHYAPLLGRLAARPLQVVGFAMAPLVTGLAWLSGRFTQGTRPLGTERQVRALALLGRRAGHIERDEISMIYRAFQLNDSTAQDIMTPRNDVVGVPAGLTIGEAAELVRETGYSRYPIYLDSLDQISGTITGRDLLDAVLTGRDSDSVKSIARRILKFEASQRSDELLSLFLDRRVHMGVVTNGTETIGIVTLEDVLEEIVGEIEEEKN